MAEKTRDNKSRYTLMRVLEKADRYLKRGADIFETVSKVGEKPGVSSIIHAGMKLTQQTLGLGFFDSLRISQWSWYNPGEPHRRCLYELLDTFPRKTFGDNEADTVIFYDLYGTTVARQKNANFVNYLEGETTPEKLGELFARAVWEKVGSPCVMLASGGGGGSVDFDYRPSPEKPLYESELCTTVMERLKPFLEHEVSRSVLFYGSPGTGKSCIVDSVAAAFGEKILSIDVSNLAYCSGSTLTEYILRLQPDILVINDLDRFSGSSQMLSTIEDLNKALKLLLVTVNDKKKLPQALQRPGRFDETILVEALDDNVALKLMGMPRNEIPDQVWEELTTWPAAFIAELGKRLKYLGRDKLVEEFVSLQERVEENKPEEEEDSKRTKTRKVLVGTRRRHSTPPLRGPDAAENGTTPEAPLENTSVDRASEE